MLYIQIYNPRKGKSFEYDPETKTLKIQGDEYIGQFGMTTTSSKCEGTRQEKLVIRRSEYLSLLSLAAKDGVGY